MNTIKVGYQVYKIVEEDLDARASHNYGLMNPAKGVIYIQEELTPSQFMNTLLHELFHACFESAGFNKVFNPDQEEQIINMLGNTFMALIIDNPGFLDYLKHLEARTLVEEETSHESGV